MMKNTYSNSKRRGSSKLPNKRIKTEDQSESGVEDIIITSKSLREYNEIRRDFNQNGISQTSQLILKRIVQNPDIPIDRRNQPLLRLLVGTLQDLALNEIETAL